MLKDKPAVPNTGRDGTIVSFADKWKYFGGSFLSHGVFYSYRVDVSRFIAVCVENNTVINKQQYKNELCCTYNYKPTSVPLSPGC